MLTVLLWVVPVVMTATTAWRLPSLWTNEVLHRHLWLCCAGFTAAVWCRNPSVKEALDSSAVTDLSALLKYAFSLAAILAGLKYIIGVYGEAGPSRHVAVSTWVSRTAHRLAITWLGLLIVLFFSVVDRSEPSVDFTADHAGQWGAGAFLTIAYTYLAAGSGVACFQWWRAGRRAEYRSLRLGLMLMSAAMLIYAVYPAVRLVMVWAPTSASNVTMRTVADAVTLTVALLWAAGAAIPSTVALTDRWAVWRMHRKLYPLWADLTQQFPHLILRPAGTRSPETLRAWGPLSLRLDQRVHEIADGIEKLRHFATPQLLPCAQRLTENDFDPDPAAEAHWIATALDNARAGRAAASPARALPAKPLSDTQAEAYWLTLVADIYAQVAPEAVRALHLRAGRPGAEADSTPAPMAASL